MALSLLTKQLLLLFLVVWAGLVIYLFAVHREQVVKEERRQKVRLLERHSLTPGSARPCGACEGAGAAGAGGPRCCWELSNRYLRAVFTDWPRVAWRALEAKALEAVSSASLAVESFPLFSLLPASEKEACGLQAVSHDAAWLRLELSCSNGILAVFSAQLREDAHYIRFKVRILSGPGWPAAGFRELQLWKLHGSSHIQETKHPRESEEESGSGPADGLWDFSLGLDTLSPAVLSHGRLRVCGDEAFRGGGDRRLLGTERFWEAHAPSRKRVRAAEGVDPPAPDMTPPHVSKSAGRTPFADSSEIFIHDWEIEDFQGRLKARRAGSKAVSAAPTAGKARRAQPE
ncbi:unnamed protein product [Effrenium voratum]|nr:unnamed protein product [Effrenium voratum]